MGLAFVIDRERRRVALYCNTDMRAFGPVLEDEDEAEEFVAFAQRYADEMEWLSTDLRSFSPVQLDDAYRRFVADQGGAEDPPKLTRGEGSSERS